MIKDSIKILLCLLVLLAFDGKILAQDCIVKKYELQDKYEGDCSKGLANGRGKAEGIDSYEGEFKNGWPHGEGVYSFADSSVFTGSFKKGLKNGSGELVKPLIGRDTVITGMWKNDKLLVPKKKVYEIIRDTNIDRVSVTKVSDAGRKVEFIFMNPRGRNSPDDLRIIADSGSYNAGSNNNNIVYEMDYPVYINVQYSMTTGLATSVLRCFLEMKFYEPGSYRVTLKTQ